MGMGGEVVGREWARQGLRRRQRSRWSQHVYAGKRQEALRELYSLEATHGQGCYNRKAMGSWMALKGGWMIATKGEKGSCEMMLNSSGADLWTV